HTETKKEKEENHKINIQSMEEEIKQRRQGYKRKAPPFARTCTGVLWQYPATQNFRRAKKLDNVEETEEEEETESGIEKWTTEQVCEWIKHMGSAFEKYVPKFRSIRGIKLKKMDEEDFCGMGLPKLHAMKLSFEIQKLLDRSIADVMIFIYFVISQHFQNKTKQNKTKQNKKRNAEVAKWAQKQSHLNQYSSKFESHGVDGTILFELTGDDLATIGVRPDHREKIIGAIREFAKQSFPNCKTIEDFSNTKKSNGDVTATGASASANSRNGENTNAASKSNHLSNNKEKATENGTIHDEKEMDTGYDENSYNNNSDSLTLKKNNDLSRHKRRQSVQMVPETPLYVQVLKDMADLLNTISGELTNEKVQKQASLIQEKVRLLLSQGGGEKLTLIKLQIKDPINTTEQDIPANDVNGKRKSADNVQPGGKSPYAEAEGKPVSGISLPYVSTLEQKILNDHVVCERHFFVVLFLLVWTKDKNKK
ncbi:hypothetical protein RFI_10408, partial [Reticulomyxa filosa]